MKATDLMIGDYVLCPSLLEAGFCKVCGMDAPTKSRKEYIMELTDQYGGRLWVYERFIKPIPLTPKILEKNGFKFKSPCINDNKDAWAYEWPNEKPNCTPHAFFLMSHHNKAKFPNFWIYAPNNPEIKYVHQLQHALRLCRIEKEIVL